MSGTMKESWRFFVTSAIQPCTGGSSAAPRIAITSSDDTWLF
jgi:hypothetical protein